MCFWRKQILVGNLQKHGVFRELRRYIRQYSNLRLYSPVNLVDYSSLEVGGNIWIYCLNNIGELYVVDGRKQSQVTNWKEQNESNERVFTDLLDGFHGDDQDMQLSSEPVSLVSSHDMILHLSEPVVSLCISRLNVIIATMLRDEYNLCLFARPNSGEVIDVNTQRFLYFPKGLVGNSSKLCIKLVSCQSEKDEAETSDCLVVSRTLFKQMFGETLSLLNSPVCLFGAAYGCVFYAPLSYFQSRTNQDKSQVQSNLKVSSRYRNLCQLPDYVSYVFKVMPVVRPVTSENTEISIVCLGVCSYGGTVMLFCENTDNQESVIVSLSLPGPVKALCSYGNRIYHSTGQCVYETVVELETANAISPQVKLQKSRWINQPHVTYIKPMTKTGTIEYPDSPCELHCVLENGEFCKLSLKDLAQQSTVESKDNIQGLLMAIENTSTQIMATRDKKKELLDKLSDVTMATYLLCEYLNKHDEGNSVETLSFHKGNSVHCKVLLSSEINQDTPRLHLEICHNLPRSLSTHWCVQVALLPMEQDGGVLNKVTMETMNISEEWESGKILRLNIPVRKEMAVCGCQLLVKFILDPSGVADSHTDTHNLSIPVFEDVVDILTFLTTGKAAGGISSRISKPSAFVRDLKTLARVKSANQMLLEHSRADDFPNTQTISLSTFVRTCNQKREENPQGLTGGLGELLKQLKDDEQYKDETKIESDVWTTFGQSGHVRVVRCPGKQDGQGDDQGSVFEVTVTADPSTAAAINLAINRRFQGLTWYNVSNKKTCLSSDKVHSLWKHVQETVECLEKESNNPLNLEKVYETLRTVTSFC